jgi:hypothetical protein
MQVYAQIVAGVGGAHEGPLAQTEQVVLRHQPCDALAVDVPALVAQLGGDAAIPVVAAVSERDLLDLPA